MIQDTHEERERERPLSRRAEHGLDFDAGARWVRIQDEDSLREDGILDAHWLTFRPEGPIEESLVRQMAAALHRLERLAPAETNIVGVQMRRMSIPLAFAELQSRNEGVTHVSREEPEGPPDGGLSTRPRKRRGSRIVG